MKAPYTALATAEAEDRVERDLGRIVAFLKDRVPAGDLVAIALIGGFARGEGGVIAGPGVAPQPFNDYDLIVLTERPVDSAAVHRDAPALAAELGIDFIDVGFVLPAVLPRVPPEIYWYELREAHRVLHGPPGAFQATRRIDPARLGLIEATNLLVNRGLALLWARLLLEKAPAASDARGAADHRFSINAIHKAVLAMGDAVLLREGRYHFSYRERQRRLAQSDLTRLGGEAGPFKAALDAAFHFKLFPSLAGGPDRELLDGWQRVSCWHESFLLWIEESRLGRHLMGWSDYPGRVAVESLLSGLGHPRRYLSERRPVGWLGLPGRFLDRAGSFRARLPFLLYSAGPSGVDRNRLAAGLRGSADRPEATVEAWGRASRELISEWHP